MPTPDNSAPTNMLSTVEALAPETRAKVDELQRTEAPAYRLAALDPDFMLGDSTRGVRFQLEYAKAQEGMKAAHIRSTIVVFGSARVSESAPGNRGRWYKEARDFGYIASRRGGALNEDGGGRFNVIATGGGPGIMEAANRGASEAGAPTIGFNITLPHEQYPNPYTTPSLTFRFHYFAMRKMHLAMHSAALVVFPGGFGTLDELFEIITLRQTGKMSFCPIVLMDKAYWTRIINFEALVEEGFIKAEDLTLFDFAETAEECWSILERKGLTAPSE
ncbi:TIGR00730 family Rossman fold protein [Labrys sedimenti]|uniref:LOG family protein n=1 Tax=Labrys sedimenti TaxID=3106036 RepID=UPI003CD0BA6D